MTLTTLNTFFLEHKTLFFIFIIWTLVWKGFSLWKAARNTHRNWFIALLIINTFGILDILYIFWIGKRNGKENDVMHKEHTNS